MSEMARFVGLGPAELELLQSTRPVVLDHVGELSTAVYENFLRFPEARKFFEAESGEIDETRLVRRRASLGRWLRGSIDFKIDADIPIQVLATGIVHSHPPSHRAHLGSIPSRFMVGAMSFVQTALGDLFCRELDDPDLALQASFAWNKMLMVQMDILLAGYMTDTTTEPTEGPNT
jgi:hypothetical protein